MRFQPLIIGDLVVRYPVIQGGMGVGISRSSLAGAVAKEGGIGIISTAQIGYDEPGFDKAPIETNLLAIEKHIRKAKEIGDGGIVGVNIMVATNDYERYVKASVMAGADVIISGAGLPVDLPKWTKGYATKIAPIVSSEKAANVILKLWDRKYKVTADFVVVEGPYAGGHLGFSREQLDHIENLDYDAEIRNIIECVKTYEKMYKKHIPVIVAGGVFDQNDIKHCMELGADGVQIASRFVVTEECDAAPIYKQAYIEARKEDVVLIDSPVGMPGRALNTPFIHQIKEQKKQITKCMQCLKNCNPKEIPYCITKALTRAVEGDLTNGLVFCGENVYRLHEMTTVHDLMQELMR